jgi:hypothetical protein
MSQPQPGRIIGDNRFFFSTNGDSFEELLRQAHCEAPPSFITAMQGNCQIPRYPHEEYELFSLKEERTPLDIVSCRGHQTQFATTRELLRFLSEFPGIARRFRRIPMLNQDYITFCNPTALPTFRAKGDGFELYREERNIVLSGNDGILSRMPLQPKAVVNLSLVA